MKLFYYCKCCYSTYIAIRFKVKEEKEALTQKQNEIQLCLTPFCERSFVCDARKWRCPPSRLSSVCLLPMSWLSSCRPRSCPFCDCLVGRSESRCHYQSINTRLGLAANTFTLNIKTNPFRHAHFPNQPKLVKIPRQTIHRRRLKRVKSARLPIIHVIGAHYRWFPWQFDKLSSAISVFVGTANQMIIYW